METPSLVFPDSRAVAQTVEWLQWWWNLRPAACRPQELLCQREVAIGLPTDGQRLIEQHEGLMQHAELPALSDMEDHQVLLPERRRKAAAIRAAAGGDINRAGMILDNNLPSRPVDAVVFRST